MYFVTGPLKRGGSFQLMISVIASAFTICIAYESIWRVNFIKAPHSRSTPLLAGPCETNPATPMTACIYLFYLGLRFRFWGFECWAFCGRLSDYCWGQYGDCQTDSYQQESSPPTIKPLPSTPLILHTANIF